MKEGESSTKQKEPSPKIENAMGANSLSRSVSSLQATHMKEKLFDILHATTGEKWKHS